jgi:hypothetical protein
MRIKRRQLVSLPRSAVALAACAAVVAMTSGLLLAIHLHNLEHPTNHGPQNCSLCRHALIAPNKFLPAPPVEFAHDARAAGAGPAAPGQHVSDHHARTSQPRAPPAGPLYSWA